jgi:hypothetical protein
MDEKINNNNNNNKCLTPDTLTANLQNCNFKRMMVLKYHFSDISLYLV